MLISMASITVPDFEDGGRFGRLMSDSPRVSLLALGWEEKYLIPLHGVSERRKTTALPHKETSHPLPSQPLNIHNMPLLDRYPKGTLI